MTHARLPWQCSAAGTYLVSQRLSVSNLGTNDGGPARHPSLEANFNGGRSNEAMTRTGWLIDNRKSRHSSSILQGGHVDIFPHLHFGVALATGQETPRQSLWNGTPLAWRNGISWHQVPDVCPGSLRGQPSAVRLHTHATGEGGRINDHIYRTR